MMLKGHRCELVKKYGLWSLNYTRPGNLWPLQKKKKNHDIFRKKVEKVIFLSNYGLGGLSQTMALRLKAIMNFDVVFDNFTFKTMVLGQNHGFKSETFG